MILLQLVYLFKLINIIRIFNNESYLKLQFFEPLEPVDITILFNNNNRPSGEANVEFANKEDAMRAMSKVKLIKFIYQ